MYTCRQREEIYIHVDQEVCRENRYVDRQTYRTYRQKRYAYTHRQRVGQREMHVFEIGWELANSHSSDLVVL